MPKNIFNSAIMKYADVSTYYPNNPNFDHFVFQQMLADPTKPDNTYTLCAYAIFTTASGLQPVPITLPPNMNGTSYRAPKGVQFANMKLEPGDLAKLYPSNPPNADITLTAVGQYLATDYVVYNASTPGLRAGGTVTLNPSPPYNN